MNHRRIEIRRQDKHRLSWVRRVKRMGSARLLLALLSVVMIVCATSAVASRLSIGQPRDVAVSIAAVLTESKSTAPGTSTPQTRAKLTDSVLLTITPRGFDLKEITVPAVPFFLLVENRSGLSNISLSLQRDGGALIKNARVEHEELDWTELLDLAPGNYVISEASHPDQAMRRTRYTRRR